MGKDFTKIDLLDLGAIRLSHIKDVLGGDVNGLMYSFKWEGTPQGSNHWVKRYHSCEELTEKDRVFLRFLCCRPHNRTIYLSHASAELMGIDIEEKHP